MFPKNIINSSSYDNSFSSYNLDEFIKIFDDIKKYYNYEKDFF